MDSIKKYIQTLFEAKKLNTSGTKADLLEDFINDDENIAIVIRILEKQDALINNWNMKSRLEDILKQMIAIPNGTVNKPYRANLDLKKMGWDDLDNIEVTGLDGIGLNYSAEAGTITGVPIQSGDIKLTLKFRIHNELATVPLHEKIFMLIINPDPKSLWKNKPGNKKDIYWKDENVSVADQLGDRHIVVSSKRGRSHANVGSFRDDDFSYHYFEETGWSIVSVADGAGSAWLSRKGSELATKSIIDFFQTDFTQEAAKEFDNILSDYKKDGGDEVQKKLSHFISDHLSKAVWSVHQKLVGEAKESGNELKDFHTTLIFTLFKKYEFGYAFLSFGVGDCPIAVINKDITEVTLMNWLDVGEYGGGTRFITMPEIFASDKFYTRFKFKLTDDFSFLIMMTDGVYDPKFMVEANLEKIENWKSFIADLKGKNEDGIKVVFDPANNEITNQLSAWMDFWSPGNHDDRTLAIVY